MNPPVPEITVLLPTVIRRPAEGAKVRGPAPESASVNDPLMQFQADLLGIPVVRPQVTETTALGAAYLAGLASGVYGSLAELAAQWQPARRFEPQLPRDQAAARMRAWEQAVVQTTAR